MEINETNKKLYEMEFIQNGEYGYHENNSWNPPIDERDIEESCQGEDGHYVPATPLGYRDYLRSRVCGIRNILDQHPSVDLRNGEHHNVKRSENRIKMYDKVLIEDDAYVVCGDDEDYFYVVSDINHLYSVAYKKDEE